MMTLGGLWVRTHSCLLTQHWAWIYINAVWIKVCFLVWSFWIEIGTTNAKQLNFGLTAQNANYSGLNYSGHLQSLSKSLPKDLDN
jgi:hypothetical protein